MAEKGRNIIIGNSSAGISALEAMRQAGYAGETILLGRESLPAYTPTVLQYLIDGRVEEDRLALREKKFYEDMGAHLLPGEEAVKVDPASRQVFTAGGGQMDFDRLLIATGTVPLVPPIEGLAGGGVFSLRTLEDARAIKACCRPEKRVLIIGAGLVGLPLAESFQRQGLKVTVVEVRPRVLPRNLDEPSSRIVRQVLEEEGIEILTAISMQKVERRSGKVIAHFSSGEKSSFDFIVVAAGVRPNLDLVRETGIAFRQGIAVDDRMRTSDPAVYAAGDVAEASDLLTGEAGLNPILADAVEQGKIAGRNMAGQEDHYAGGLCLNVFSFFGNTAFSIGLFQARGKDYEVFTQTQPGQRFYRKLVFREDRLVGAILLNDSIDPGAVQSLIRQKEDLGPWKRGLTSPHVDRENWLGWVLRGKGIC